MIIGLRFGVWDVEYIGNWVLLSLLGGDDTSASTDFAVICISSCQSRRFKGISSAILDDSNHADGCLLFTLDSAAANKVILSLFAFDCNFKGDFSTPAWVCEIGAVSGEDSKQHWAIFGIQRKSNFITVVGPLGSLHVIDIKTGAKRYHSNICSSDQILSLKVSLDDSFGSFITKNERKICYFDMKSVLANLNATE